MKVGIYNNFWSTMGGGEQSAMSYASYFARQNTVDLISSNEIPLKKLAEVFNRPDSLNYKTRKIATGNAAITACSKDYDFFICHSYLSETYSLAKRSMYVCMFPHIFNVNCSKDVRLLVDQETSLPSNRDYSDRISLKHGDRVDIVIKTDRESLSFITSGAIGKVVITPANNEKSALKVVEFTIDKQLHNVTLTRGRYSLRFLDKASNSAVVHLDALRISNELEPSISKKVRQIDPLRKSFLASYDLVLANSEYTSSFITERWGAESRVHYPSVNLRMAPTFEKKEKIILSIGRFFDGAHGHSKRQLELVKAFKRIYESGVSDWRLVLIGGCDRDNREYALEVKRQANGLPIDVVLNADIATLNQYLEKSAIYWHATGLCTDLNKSPDKAEHFGIAPVEAMSAGCIPILYGIGGTAELVVDEESGFLFFSEDQLVSITKQVLNLPEEAQAKLAKNAIERASRFSQTEFEKKLESFVNEIF